MKKYLYLLFVVTAFISCSKEEQTPDNLRQQMVDKWFYRTSYLFTYSPQGKVLDSTRITTNGKDTFEFKDNGSYTITTANGTNTTSGTFNTSTTTSFILKEGGTSHTCRVISINLYFFIFSIQDPKVSGQNYTETKVTLFR